MTQTQVRPWRQERAKPAGDPLRWLVLGLAIAGLCVSLMGAASLLPGLGAALRDAGAPAPRDASRLRRRLNDALAALARSGGRPDPALVEEARQTALTIIAQAPADSDAWIVLAGVDLALSPPAWDAAVAAYRMSHLTGRLEWPAIERRVRFALANWRRLDSDDRALGVDDIRTMLSNEPVHRVVGALATTANQLRGAEGAKVLRAMVEAFRPEWLKQYDNWVLEPPTF